MCQEVGRIFLNVWKKNNKTWSFVCNDFLFYFIIIAYTFQLDCAELEIGHLLFALRPSAQDSKSIYNLDGGKTGHFQKQKW